MDLGRNNASRHEKNGNEALFYLLILHCINIVNFDVIYFNQEINKLESIS